jgi:hypothetical protein
MYSHQHEELARQRIAEMRREARADRGRRARRQAAESRVAGKIRVRAGWTLVAIGLRMAESSSG